MQRRNDQMVGLLRSEFRRPGGCFSVVERYPTGVDGPPFPPGAYLQRALNTVLCNDIGADVSALPVVTLPRGIYNVHAVAIGHEVGDHKTRIYDLTTPAVLLTGISMRSLTIPPAARGVQNGSDIWGHIYVASTLSIQLEHACSDGNLVDGMGSSTGLGEPETYAMLEIHKVR